jgi:hypothetical protein
LDVNGNYYNLVGSVNQWLLTISTIFIN